MNAQRIKAHIDLLTPFIGREIGVSPWVRIDQKRIDAHARTTGDDAWIHTDPARAARETPFGCTIAQNFLLMSLLTDMAQATNLPTDGVAYRTSYGFDRLRIVQPVPVGSRVRGRFELRKIEAKGHHGVLVYLDASIEIEDDDLAPALAAEWLIYRRLED
ncbi:MAG: MaoC family dehydratase [Gammaproteobacteria bacterium]|nr:MaoC family dehydratase [Gammaproteobacteria bacterium]